MRFKKEMEEGESKKENPSGKSCIFCSSGLGVG